MIVHLFMSMHRATDRCCSLPKAGTKVWAIKTLLLPLSASASTRVCLPTLEEGAKSVDSFDVTLGFSGPALSPTPTPKTHTFPLRKLSLSPALAPRPIILTGAYSEL